MRMIDQITCVFDDAAAKKWEAALLHACTSIDATARKLFPSQAGVGKRFVRCIRDYYWLVEPMMGVGFNLVDTRFSSVSLPNGNNAPDFAELVYHIHRCSHAHGDEVPVEFSITPSMDAFHSSWKFAPNSVRIPDKVIWALTAISVFSHVNYRLRGSGAPYRLFWGNEFYPISEWWGREQEIKVIAIGWNTQRIEIKELSRLKTADPVTGSRVTLVSVAPPPKRP